MAEAKDVKLEKLILNIDGDKVSLTMEQAKKLKSILDELFGKEIIKEVVEKHHHYNDNWWYRPYVSWQGVGGTGINPINPNIVYCAASNALQVNC